MLEPWSSCVWRVTTGYHRKGSTREPNSTIATTNRIWFFDTDGRYWYILTSLSQWFWVVSLKNSQQNYQNWAAGEATQPPPTPPYDGPSHRPGTAASVHSPVPAICIWSAGPAQRDFPICSLALSNKLAASDIYIYIIYTYNIILCYVILYHIILYCILYFWHIKEGSNENINIAEFPWIDAGPRRGGGAGRAKPAGHATESRGAAGWISAPGCRGEYYTSWSIREIIPKWPHYSG